MRILTIFAGLLLASVSTSFGQDAASSDPLRPDPDMPRPIDALDSVFLEELPWLEVRDAMRGGKGTVIVATGGIEQNGPYLALGKHNYIPRATAEAIARKLGDALVAPIVPFVPEGNIDPPSGHMLYPGSISVSDETFRALLTDIAESLRVHGFRHVIFLSDSGGNVAGMTSLAGELAKKWAGEETTIHYIPEYYKSAGARKFLESQGIHQTEEGRHDNVSSSAQMMVVDPTTVRMKQRIDKGKMSINGISLAPPRGFEISKKVIDYRATLTVAAIGKALGKQ